jgi:hypothetical protein
MVEVRRSDVEMVTCKTFYELSTNGSERVHYLIELEHPAAIDARLCWLQATARACELLQRMPNTDELRPISEAQARALARPMTRQRRTKSQLAGGTKSGGRRPKTKKVASTGSRTLEARLVTVLESAAEARAASRELPLKGGRLHRAGQRLRPVPRDAWYVTESLRHRRPKPSAPGNAAGNRFPRVLHAGNAESSPMTPRQRPVAP